MQFDQKLIIAKGFIEKIANKSMKSNKQIKIYTCKYCKNTTENIGISTKESRCYSFDLNTKQWKDFHRSESIDSQEYFCINCNKKINIKIVDSLIN